jgi:AcrR family transcriptional regulator
VGPSERRRLAPELRREQLLDAAVTLAAGGDIGAISVEEIAGEAGISVGLLYHYFPTKQALVVAAVQRAADAFLADVRAAATGPPLEQLAAGLGAYLDHVQEQPTGWKALLQANAGELLDIGIEVEEESLRLVLEALEIDTPSAVLLVALKAWAQFERSVCLEWLLSPSVPRSAIEDMLISSFLETLNAVARHDEPTARAVARILGTA